MTTNASVPVMPSDLDDAIYDALLPHCGPLTFATVDIIWRLVVKHSEIYHDSAPLGVAGRHRTLVMELGRLEARDA